MQFLKPIVDIIYTPKCIACGDTRQEKYICKKCLSDVQFLCVDSYSPINKHLSSLWSMAVYEGPWMEVIHQFKYGKGRAANSVIFSILKNYLGRFDHADCIIPVPQHVRRYISRGYNQSAIIAKMISKVIDRPVYHRALIKSVNTPPQVGMTLKKRMDNLKGVFARPCLFSQSVDHKNVLLVDDVVTSGSTVDECARILRKAGAKRVDVLTLAKAL